MNSYQNSSSWLILSNCVWCSSLLLGNFTEFSVINCQKIQKIINYWKTFPITDEPNVTQTSCLLLKIRSWTVNKQKKKLFHYVSSLRFLKGEFCLKTLPLHPEELRVFSLVGFDAKKTSFSFCVFQWMPVFQCYLLGTTLGRRSMKYLWMPSCQFSSHPYNVQCCNLFAVWPYVIMSLTYLDKLYEKNFF